MGAGVVSGAGAGRATGLLVVIQVNNARCAQCEELIRIIDSGLALLFPGALFSV